MRREPERARRNHCAGDSAIAISPPSAAPDPIRRGARDESTVPREGERTPRGNRAAPTAPARGHRHGPFPTTPDLSPPARPPPRHCKIRAPVAGVPDRSAAAPADPAPFAIAPPLPPLPSGRRTSDRLLPSRRPIFQPARPRRNAARRARLSVHQRGGEVFEGGGNPGMELPPGTAQQSAVSGLLDKRVFEQVLRGGRHAALKDQAGIDEA